MSGPVRIVRKRDASGFGVACWLDADKELRGWYISAAYDTPNDQAKGWPMTESCANAYGTTLSALHQELTEGGEGANDSQV